jgi:hypothetical protein
MGNMDREAMVYDRAGKTSLILGHSAGPEYYY